MHINIVYTYSTTHIHIVLVQRLAVRGRTSGSAARAPPGWTPSSRRRTSPPLSCRKRSLQTLSSHWLTHTVSPRTQNLDFTGFGFSRFLGSRRGIPRPMGDSPEIQTRRFLACGLLAREVEKPPNTGVCEESTFYVSLGHAIRQQKLPSSPRFGAFKTVFATGRLIRRCFVFHRRRHPASARTSAS